MVDVLLINKLQNNSCREFMCVIRDAIFSALPSIQFSDRHGGIVTLYTEWQKKWVHILRDVNVAQTACLN